VVPIKIIIRWNLQSLQEMYTRRNCNVREKNAQCKMYVNIFTLKYAFSRECACCLIYLSLSTNIWNEKSTVYVNM
jgi:hypothetical protein